jgi:predicted molibdopterin-dependent oxidoreductase YjgC
VGDLNLSDVILVDGVDLARQAPTLGGIVIRAALGKAALIVVDTRRHRVAEHADVFLQIRPGTEATLYGAMCRVILDRGLENRSFLGQRCSGLEGFIETMPHFDLLSAAEECGVSPEAIEEAALMYAGAPAASLIYSTGLEARHEETIRASVNLALLTGQIGRPGAGIYALTEHNNLQGVCDMGMLPTMLPGYRRVTDVEASARLGKLWQANLPVHVGLSAREVLGGLGDGSIRALWLGRYDPVSTAFFGEAAWALQECEFVVVQHLFMTETAAYADVILPTTAFGEETVTFTSMDRRIQVAEGVADAPGETEPAWKHIVRIARAMGADWSYDGPDTVMHEIGLAVPFYEAAGYDNLRRDYGVQWPCTRRRPMGTPRLFEDDAEDRGRFHLEPVRPPAHARASPEFPLTLVFGYSDYYWHQNVLIKHSETLKREYGILLLDYPGGFVEVNTEDARELSVRDGEKVRLCAEGGSVEIAARVTPEVRRGAVFVPYFVQSVDQTIHSRAASGAPYVPVRVERVHA